MDEKIVNRGQKRRKTGKKKKKLQIQGLIRYSVSLLNAEFDLFVFTDCRPFILTHGLVKIDTKGKYLNIFSLFGANVCRHILMTPWLL